MPESADDRRLTARILAKWTAITDGQRLPRPEEITPEVFGGDWRYAMLVTVDRELQRSRLQHVGDTLCAGHRKSDMVEIVGDYSEHSLLRLAVAKIPAVLAKKGPITFGGTGAVHRKAMLYRAILLPVSNDGDSISHVLGAIGYRDISAALEITAEEPDLAVPNDPVSSFIAFSSRRMIFAPSVPRRPEPTGTR